MELTEHPVIQRPENSPKISGPADFVLGDGQAVPRSRMTDPDVSPYCFDFNEGNVLCVSTPDISSATFFYQAQRKQARTVIKVPFEALPDAPASPILLFSMGRCGSTLLQKVLESAGVRSVGEPDYFTQVAMSPDRHKTSKPFLKRILGGTTGLLRHPLIKFRAECCHAAVLIASSFPSPRVLFLLREPVDWAASIHRVSRNAMPAQYIASGLCAGLKRLENLTECFDVQILYYEDFQVPNADYFNQVLSLMGRDSRVTKTQVETLAGRDAQEGTPVGREAMGKIPEDPAFRGAFREAWGRLRPSRLIEQLQLRNL